MVFQVRRRSWFRRTTVPGGDGAMAGCEVFIGVLQPPSGSLCLWMLHTGTQKRHVVHSLFNSKADAGYPPPRDEHLNVGYPCCPGTPQ